MDLSDSNKKKAVWTMQGKFEWRCLSVLPRDYKNKIFSRFFVLLTLDSMRV